MILIISVCLSIKIKTIAKMVVCFTLSEIEMQISLSPMFGTDARRFIKKNCASKINIEILYFCNKIV